MYDPDMSSKTVAVDLESENLIWLQARATASGARNLSKTLNEVLAKVRTGGVTIAPRSVRGTIQLPESDPDLSDGQEKVRELFRRSLQRTARALAESKDTALMLKLIGLSEEEELAGQTVPQDEVFGEARRRLAAR